MAPKLPLMAQLQKQFAGPINPDSIYESLEDAQAYARSGYGAPGEIIAVKSEDDNVYNVYSINTDKELTIVMPVGEDYQGNKIDFFDVLDALQWKTVE